MPLFTPEQLHQVRDIIRRYHQAAAVNLLGPDTVPASVLAELQAIGLVDISQDLIRDAYVYGAFAEITGPDAASMNGQEVLAQLRRQPIPPLTQVEQESIRTAVSHAGQYVTGLGDRVTAQVMGAVTGAESDIAVAQARELIADRVARNRARRETAGRLKSDLGNAIGDWNRDWDRVAATEVNNAVQMGHTETIRKRYGDEELISKIPRPDACPQCKKHYLRPDGLPVVKPVSWWEAQGSNVGKKQAQWGPTLEGMHPWCSCQVTRVPAGMVWTEGPDGIELIPEGLELSVTNELGDLRKAVARGGKYVRRVPYTDAKGRRRYRYYYRESAAARATRAGETIRLGDKVVEVLAVAADGTVTLKDDGGQLVVPPGDWHKTLIHHYGEQFAKSAERRAAQALNAVTRHVPRELLADLKGDTDEARLADLQKRVPDVYARLQKAFGRAGMTAFEAKSMLSRVLRRRGWTPEARGTVIGGAIRHREVGVGALIRASEGLAGGATVRPDHVAAAVVLRAPGGKPRDFAASVIATAVRAEAELVKLKQLIDSAKTGKIPDAEVLAAGVAAEAVQRLTLLAQAFPGVRDRAVEPAQKAMAAIAALDPKTEGAVGVVYVAGEGGKPVALKAKYRLMEAGDVQASHDSESFRPNPKYPEGVQERAYHRDKAEQAKVMRNAQRMNPAFVVNTNPDAVNGPPIIMAGGIVLGGNSRAMSMQRVYESHPKQAAELRAYLKEHAHEVGFSPEDIDAMKRPMLVREVEVPDESKVGLQLMVRQMNESFTQGMDPRTMQVAMGRRLSDSTLLALGSAMGEDETLASFLASPRSGRFVASLFKDGVIDQRNFNQYVVKGTQRLNQDGVTLVSRILVGRQLQDADLLSNTGPRMVEALAQSVPAMMQAESYGHGFALGEDLRVAVSAFNDLQHRVSTGAIPALDSNMSDRTYHTLYANFEMLPGIGEPHPILENPKARTLLEVLIRRRGPIQMAKFFRAYAKRAAKSPEGQSVMFGVASSPAEVLADTVREVMGKEALPPAHVVAAMQPALMLSLEPFSKSRRTPGENVGPKVEPAHRPIAHVNYRGLLIAIEQRAGDRRNWQDPETGQSGVTQMSYPYGYIVDSKGADGGGVDVYIGPDERASRVYVIHQVKRLVTGEFEGFDEDKVMLGFSSSSEAQRAFLVHYDDPRFFGSMDVLSFAEFKRKVGHADGEAIEKAMTLGTVIQNLGLAPHVISKIPRQITVLGNMLHGMKPVAKRVPPPPGSHQAPYIAGIMDEFGHGEVADKRRKERKEAKLSRTRKMPATDWHDLKMRPHTGALSTNPSERYKDWIPDMLIQIQQDSMLLNEEKIKRMQEIIRRYRDRAGGLDIAFDLYPHLRRTKVG